MNLAEYIAAQKSWSQRTFGNGARTVGICKHIQEELAEIQRDPNDVMEWIDVIILAIDGAWRAGFDENKIVDSLLAKQQINFSRAWPSPQAEDVPTEHIRDNMQIQQTTIF